jgi:hypothetical protein
VSGREAIGTLVVIVVFIVVLRILEIIWERRHPQ